MRYIFLVVMVILVLSLVGCGVVGSSSDGRTIEESWTVRSLVVEK